MKKLAILFGVILLICSATACRAAETETESQIQETETEFQIQETETETKQVIYENITAAEAKEIMDTETGYVILDVRTEEEFAEGHIEGAILIPNDEIAEKAEGILTDKDQKILVYCRSGRRSKLAAEALLALGYTNVWEFGGIIDWPYEIVK